jgi:PEP-CTERM motif
MNVARTKGLVLPLLLTLAAAGGTMAHAGSITNGTFTTPASSSVFGGGTVNWTGGQYGYDPSNIDGWSFTGGAGVQQNGSAWGFAAAPGGAGQTAFLQSYQGGANVGKGNPTSTISQTVGGLTVGQQYTVSFYLAQRPGDFGLNPVTVTIDGVTMTITPASTAWTEYTESFTYDGGPDVLTFSVTGTGEGNYDNDTGLADVDMTATPEPGTLLLLGSGLLGFAGLARRRFSRNDI